MSQPALDTREALLPQTSPSQSSPPLFRWSSHPTLQLSLTSSYAPHWTRREGIRELVQNWLDGCQLRLQSLNALLPPAALSSSPFTLLIRPAHPVPPSLSSPTSRVLFHATAVRSASPAVHLGHLLYSSASSSLTFVNRATTLTRKILLIGYSTKRGSDAMVGSFGEGMKVGLLALLRAQCGVWMQTAGELWKFGFYDDEGYGERLLGVFTLDQPTTDEEVAEEEEEAARAEAALLRPVVDPSNRTDTTTVVSGVTSAEWSAWMSDFLFLSPPPPSSHVVLSHGALLLSEAHRHRLYVKGFLVAVMASELTYGVDLRGVSLDRDRKAILQVSELHQKVGAAWVEAVGQRPDLLPTYYDLLLHHSTAAESRNAEYYLTATLIESVASTFFAQHGPLSQPVLNDASDDVLFISSQLQRRPVLVPAGLYEILTRSARIESVQALMARHEAASLPSIALTSLTPQQLHVLQSAVRLVQLVAPLFTVEDVGVTRFTDDSVWCKEEGEDPATSKVTLDTRCFDVDAVHERWGDCGLRERRIDDGRGRALGGLVTMSECSCREAAIASLVIKESRKVRWRKATAVQSAKPQRGGDAIMAHLARSRESDMVLVSLVERLVRRGEREKLRRTNLEEEKLAILTHLAIPSAPPARPPLTPPVVPVEEAKVEQERKDDSAAEVVRLRHEVQVARAEAAGWKEQADKEAAASAAREQALAAEVRAMSGVGLEEASDARLTEWEATHVDALRGIMKVREERRLKAREEDEERRKRGECAVCMAAAIDCVLLPCRHSGVCSACAQRMERCGLCRTRIEQRIAFIR